MVFEGERSVDEMSWTINHGGARVQSWKTAARSCLFGAFGYCLACLASFAPRRLHGMACFLRCGVIWSIELEWWRGRKEVMGAA